MNRYSRHIILPEIGVEGQKKLTAAKVLVVGAGGLGCPILQYLAASGVGTIGIVDFDIVEESNLQRQILFGTSTLGKNKAIAAKDYLVNLNPTIKIKAFPVKLTEKNAITFFESYDIIVDCTDNFATRYLINDAALIANKPLVYGAIYKFEGQVTVFNYENGPSYRCLFPTPPRQTESPNCSAIGVLGVLPGIIGTMQANEVLKIILELGNVLSGTLLCYNALTTEMLNIKIMASDKIKNNIRHRKTISSSVKQQFTCKKSSDEISIKTVIESKNVQFIDVREFDEQPYIKFKNIEQIPLDTLTKNISRLSGEKDKIFFCQSGIRSKKALLIAQQHNIKNCYSLKEGAMALLVHLK